MRILHIDKFLPGWGYGGGVESCINAMADAQRTAGHNVTEFGTARDDNAPEMPRFFDFSAARNPLNLPRMIHNTQAASTLSKFLLRRKIDVAHIHSLYHHLTPSILPVLSRRGIGIVMQMHDYRMACPTKHFLRPGEQGHCMRCHPNKYFHAIDGRCAGAAGAAAAAVAGFASDRGSSVVFRLDWEVRSRRGGRALAFSSRLGVRSWAGDLRGLSEFVWLRATGRSSTASEISWRTSG